MKFRGIVVGVVIVVVVVVVVVVVDFGDLDSCSASLDISFPSSTKTDCSTLQVSMSSSVCSIVNISRRVRRERNLDVSSRPRLVSHGIIQ